MTVEYIRYMLTNHTPDALVAAYQQAAEHLKAAPECVAFELSQCDEEPASFILRIHWTSADGHMKGFRGGPNFPPFLAAIRPFIPEITEMRHYSRTSVRSNVEG